MATTVHKSDVSAANRAHTTPVHLQGSELEALGQRDEFDLADLLLSDDLFEQQLASVPELRVSSGADGDGGLSPLLSPDSAARCRASSPQASAGSAAPQPDRWGSGTSSSAKEASSCMPLDLALQVRSRPARNATHVCFRLRLRLRGSLARAAASTLAA